MSDTERLIAWMERNGYDSASLSAALDYSVNIAAGVIGGRVAITHSFRRRFGEAFGRVELDEVFQDYSVPSSLAAFGDWHEHGKAHGAVNKAIREKELPHPTTMRCHGCSRQAGVYHHESYAPSDRLCVVPLCRTCHRRHHAGRKPLSFGVVPTAVGIVRIAIASVPA